VAVNALYGMKSQLSTIGTNLKKLAFGEAVLAGGLRPVYRITSSTSLSDGLVTDRYLSNTIPDWVDVKSFGDDHPHLKPSISHMKQLLKFQIETAFLDPRPMNAVVGILMDESPKNIYRYLVDIIFTNVPYITAEGNRKWLAEDFLLLGFPIQVSVGFIDMDGNFRKHPSEAPISTYGNVPPDFTGILGAITQETFASGDFFQGTFVGYEYLLSRYHPQEPFPVRSREPITRTLARMLRWLATRSILHSTVKMKKATSSDATIGIPILRTMGVMQQKGTRILSTEEIRKNIVLLDMPKYGRISKRTIPDFGELKFRTIQTWSSFKEILRYVQELTNTRIYFNGYGRLTVSGRPKVREIATKKYNRIRVHDGIIGNNVIHHQATIDLSQIVNRVVIHNVFSNINAESPIMKLAYPNKGVLMERDEVAKYYADDDSVGISEVYYYDDVEIAGPDVIDIQEQMIDHFRYYGMRGTCFMTGNPKIRVGDVLRLSDIRSTEITGINNQLAVAQLSKEAQFTIDNVDNEGLQDDPLIERSFKLKTGLDHFFIWKVVHYIGPDGFKTKVFYIKERDSYRPGSDLLAQHIRRRRRGIAGEFK
jgi:hypothetical protein